MSMRNIYRKIAKEHGVTVADVKRDMQEAIHYAYENKLKNYNMNEQEGLHNNASIPTAEEFIKHIVQEIKG
ncbi:MAG: sporulation initiation factor Spo0A C-terminal domain-containing protein [Anaerotignaceae bacterium]